MVVNVGQGNFAIAKSGQHAVVADIGYNQAGSYKGQLKKLSMPIINFLAGCDVTVIITHAHFDHYSFLNDFSELQGITISKIFYSDYGKQNAIAFPPNVQKHKIDSIHNLAVIYLGNMQLDFVLPYEWPQTKCKNRSNDPNDNSLAFVLSHTNRRKVLFTGDATGATLNAVQKVPSNKEKLKNISCMIIPHHGSNLSGAHSWFYFIRDNTDENFQNPLLTFISSDPEEADHLPWYGVSEFLCWRGQQEPCVWHELSTANGKIKTNQPIFLSANAKANYWTIILDQDTAKIFDGDNNGVDFLSSAEDTEYIIDKRNELNKLLNAEALNTEEITNFIKNISLLNDADRGAFLLMLVTKYLDHNNDYFDSIVMECINHFDLLFLNNTEQKLQFLQNILNISNFNASNTRYINLLKCFLDHYELFPAGNDYRGILINLLNKFLQTSEKPVTKCQILDKCFGKPEIMNADGFTKFVFDFLENNKDSLNINFLLNCIENAHIFHANGFNFLDACFNGIKHLSENNRLSFEDLQDLIKYSTDHIKLLGIEGLNFLKLIVNLMTPFYSEI